MWKRLASARAVAAQLLRTRRRQPVPEAEDARLRPPQPPRDVHQSGTRSRGLTDEERREAAALELVSALLEQIAEGCRGRPAADAARVHSRDESCPACPGYGHALDGDDRPPPGHTTRYSDEVRRFAAYRDLYQPD